VYLHGDHLGSVSLATNTDGDLVSQARYSPYGQVRWSGDTAMPTKYAFTGQRQDGFGLMDYHARFYSPRLGSFISADSIIPNPMNPKGFDHYAYVGNNPIIYRDPTGHSYCDSKYKAEDVDCSYTAVDILREFYGVDFYNGKDGTWTKDQIFLVYLAVMDVGHKLASTIEGGISGSDAFRKVYNTDDRRLIFLKGNQSDQFYWDGSGYDEDGNPNGCEISSGACTVGSTKTINGDSVWLIKVVSMWRTPKFWGKENFHELGHLFNAAMSGAPCRLIETCRIRIFKSQRNFLGF
jgi:RHS repeat-associated protein